MCVISLNEKGNNTCLGFAESKVTNATARTSLRCPEDHQKLDFPVN